MDYRRTIQNSLDYIEDNLKAEITPHELADIAGFSLYHYYRLFRYATGLRINAYILRRRLLHAIFEIHSGRRKTDAALDYGFDTYSGFYKAFLREFGCTPSTFSDEYGAIRPYRPSLYQEEPMIVTPKKAASLLTRWNLGIDSATDIRAAGENAYYVGSDYILKFTANPGKAQNHIALSRFIDDAGLMAALPLPTADGEEYITDGQLCFYVTRRLSGDPVSAASLYRSDGPEKARFIGSIIGKLHRALEQLDVPVNDNDLLQTVSTWALPKAGDALSLSTSWRRIFYENLERLYPQLPRHIIHRDPNPGNIILSGEKWGFIDFDLSERNARIYDPCYAATAILSETYRDDQPELLEKWLVILDNIIAGYHSQRPLTPEELEAIPYIILSNQLVCVAWFAEQNKYADIYETNKRMTLRLIAHLLP